MKTSLRFFSFSCLVHILFECRAFRHPGPAAIDEKHVGRDAEQNRHALAFFRGNKRFVKEIVVGDAANYEPSLADREGFRKGTAHLFL